MILNTGCRTDIPAYFSEWFYTRINEGYVLVRNPYYPQQVTKYVLTPELIDCIAFCTKNPEPMLARLNEIDAYRQFWFVTITPYGKEIEPNVPDKVKVMESFKQLARKVGIQAISWRYDPIFISEKYSVDYHIEAFEKMAKTLAGYTDSCVISFIDLYVKTRRNFPEVREVTKADRITLGKAFVQIGKKYGITIRSCHEGEELKEYGIDVSGCMTQPIIERAIECNLELPKSKSTARVGCNCLLGSDIGAYNTCGHGCVYCYANYNQKIVKENLAQHDPKSPFLIGGAREGDMFKEAKQVSYRDDQMTLDFFAKNW